MRTQMDTLRKGEPAAVGVAGTCARGCSRTHRACLRLDVCLSGILHQQPHVMARCVTLRPGAHSACITLWLLAPGVHIVVATPGRLKDLLSKRRMNLDICRCMCVCVSGGHTRS